MSPISALAWYDLVAPIYRAASLEGRYRAARAEAIQALKCQPGDVVADVFCGAGVNLRPLAAALDGRGTVLGFDGSAPMLERARSEAGLVASSAVNVGLVQADFTSPEGVERVVGRIKAEGAGKFLFTLGLTCLPNWREFFRAIFEAAPDGARFAIMDVQAPAGTAGARLVNWSAAADVSRPVWEELERRAMDFRRCDFRPFQLIAASVVVACGTKTGSLLAVGGPSASDSGVIGDDLDADSQ